MSSPERRFQVIRTATSAQKNSTGSKKSTKFDKSAVYTGTPERAARKAFTNLCGSKGIKGRCALNVTVQDVGKGKTPLTYQNGKPKVHSYSLRRVKLSTPVKLEVNGKAWEHKYKVVTRSTPDVCTKNSKLRRCRPS